MSDKLNQKQAINNKAAGAEATNGRAFNLLFMPTRQKRFATLTLRVQDVLVEIVGVHARVDDQALGVDAGGAGAE